MPNPSHKTSQFAAHAIVLDICVDNDQRRDMARQFKLSGCIPDTLQVISVARTTGAQTIYRSELLFEKICEWFVNAIIYSASAAALSAVGKCQTAGSPGAGNGFQRRFVAEAVAYSPESNTCFSKDSGAQ